MIQEYLFSNNDSKREIKEHPYDKSVDVQLASLKNTECWTVSFSVKGNSREAARLLSKINDYVMTFNPTVLTNESSVYFNNFLYPYFNEFERKLRKLLYLKSRLNSDDKSEPNVVALEAKTIGDIFEMLFIDKKFIENVRKNFNDRSWSFSKKEILQRIEGISEDQYWHKLVGENVIPELQNNYLKIRQYRNDVMHAHNIDYRSFCEALRLIKNVNEQLNTEIDKVICMAEESTTAYEETNFNDTLRDALSDSTKQGNLRDAIDTLRENIADATIKLNLENVYRAIEATHSDGDSIFKPSVTLQEYNKEISENKELISQLKSIQASKDALEPLLKEMREIRKLFQKNDPNHSKEDKDK